MQDSETDPTFVVMAKQPVPGQVNTRLIDGRHFDAQAATDLAWAMLRCVVDRLASRGRVVLATSPGGCGAALAREIGHPGLATIEQGDGDLGTRLDRVWAALAGPRALAFFGMDSPDVPSSCLDGLSSAIAGCDVAIGPTSDGGYWTLAASSYCPQVLRGIDWGSGSVYDQTCRRATDARLRLVTLPAWHDVDRPDDVFALAHRLDRLSRGESTGDAPDEALRRLAERLHEVLDHDRRSARGTPS